MPVNICKPSAHTASRSKSLLCRHSNQGHSLLEDWPCNYSASHYPRKEVTFSEYSELLIYNNGKSYESTKSYSTTDRKNFGARAALDASRIRNLISQYPLQTGRAIQHTMDLGLIKHEELVGIEHLVSEKIGATIVYERRAHVATVLRAQELMQEKHRRSVDNVLLAKVARGSSSRSTERARVRAAWSIDDGKVTHHVSSSTRYNAASEAKIRAAYAA
ncbi:hypothetical protein ACHAW6_009468 [Cyclotella cf. meneghiniana]